LGSSPQRPPQQQSCPCVAAGSAAGPPPKVTAIDLYVAKSFVGWRATVLDAMRACCNADANGAVGGAGGATLRDGWMDAALEAAGGHEELAGLNAKQVKAAAMPFVKFKAAEAQEGGAQVRQSLHLVLQFQLLIHSQNTI
jgi:hypothetical protein